MTSSIPGEAQEAVALVTGGTRAIGRSISLTLAQNGYAVVANYLSRQAEAELFLDEIQTISQQSLVIQADVSQPAEAARLVEKAEKCFGRLDLLVNNVGPWMDKAIIDTSPEEWRAVLEGSLSSAFFCIRAALPTMRSQGKGCIINIGAINSELFPSGDPYSPVFGLAKAAVTLMVRNLAYSEGPYGIRVNAVSPGLIETPDYANIPPEQLAEQIARIPLGRVGRPEDVAQAVLYLASDHAAYVTGTILHVHGGLTHRDLLQ
jgi:3-oxoacyl-[acyl-carrier protein] reductase